MGILRLSGPGAAQAAARVFRPKGTRALPDAPDRQLLYGTLLDQAGQALDTGLAFVSRAPHSYTGEETAELQCHGSPMVLSWSWTPSSLPAPGRPGPGSSPSGPSSTENWT
ncbi:MAG: hypothetical protein ACLT9P_00275 [Evtepia gabavorous]